jgi:hypothetical protein
MMEVLLSVMVTLAIIFFALSITIRFSVLILRTVVVMVLSSVVGCFIFIGFILGQLLV